MEHTSYYCDRCGVGIVFDPNNFSKAGKVDIGIAILEKAKNLNRVELDLCHDCYKGYISFLKVHEEELADYFKSTEKITALEI